MVISFEKIVGEGQFSCTLFVSESRWNLDFSVRNLERERKLVLEIGIQEIEGNLKLQWL